MHFINLVTKRVWPQSQIDLLACWKDQFYRHQNVDIWNAIPIASCGIFGGKETLKVSEGVKDLF